MYITIITIAALLIVPTAHAYLSDYVVQDIEWRLQDVESDIQEIKREKASNTFRNLVEIGNKTLKKLRSMGYEAVFPVNYGAILAGTAKEPICDEHSRPLYKYCICDEGYEARLLYGCKKSINTKEMNDARQKAREGFERDGYRCPDGPIPKEYPALRFYCEGTTPTRYQPQEKMDDCPLNSRPSGDGSTCECDVGYEPDATQKYCAPIRKIEEVDKKDAQTSYLPNDVPSDAWYVDALRSFIEEDDIKNDVEFRPQDKATRGDFVKLLVNSIGVSLGEIDFPEDGEARFSDVPGIYQLAFEKAASKGWLKGEGECLGTHPCYGRPDSSINRAEAATLLNRAYDFRSFGGGPQFDDLSRSEWFYEAIKMAANHCVLHGDAETGRVRPGDTLNRAEMVVMIDRAGQNLRYPNCE